MSTTETAPAPEAAPPLFDETLRYTGQRISADRDGLTYTATAEHDDHHGAPWKEEDGHGPVREVAPRQYGGAAGSKRAGEMWLVRPDHRCRGYLYDYAEACRMARAEQWGTRGGRQPGETARAYAARAAMADFRALRAWIMSEWEYVTLVVTVRDTETGVELGSAALGGMDIGHPEGDDSYIAVMLEELAEQAAAEAAATLARLASRHKLTN